jgi:threonylcarbamoyladenosine tRNA methylthiotransferase MtaB
MAGIPHPVTMTRAWLHTFGCKANQYDTERIRQSLESFGVVPVASPDGADLALLNTCTVTSEADRDARRLIRRLAREQPELRIVVAGCSAALREAEYASMPEVWRVVPGQDPRAVVRVVTGGPERDLVRLRGAGASLLANFRRGTRAWLKVQDGCDRRCSFCATRIVRGASRSRPPEEVVAEARLLSREHPELVITGIHIAH